ncbi:S-isoprenylcysteine methyltransferase [Sedimentitalea sp. CY04]|uniref:S-isoprenylcysteine methyltransferase n=1 Tax=Parasedimentitalea denitrificans TaxID=2211118 RepID=A0ABX0W1J1_9RHOB|nr:isoprenylcysteine carboxylmethyltransferase family protein [Sedimentitalea sp. CY04]NIZ59499.1 S-isoprenylcysteine methyltransferase [Sedimentitalea sp. CY04]
MRWMNTPPVWLFACVMLSWLQSEWFSFGLSFGGTWADLLAGLLIGAGIILALLAVHEMRRHKTTVIPHKTPTHLVQSGIFSRSRNPIYLGDVLILAGFILRFDAVLSLPLIPIFVWIMERGFILQEEDRMRRTFRADWARYEQKTRRWV